MVTITAMRCREKRQITNAAVLEIDLDRFASSLVNALAARSQP